jgi:DNA-binding GntR family transcriptional regulator
MNANEEEFLPYDDDEAIKFIRNQIPQELKEKFSDDDLNYLIDLIYEFYEEKGFLNDDDTEVDIDLDELTAYVVKQSKKDKVGAYTEEEISFVVDAEIAYCDSLGVFE